jgi:gluconolactonase
LAQSSAWAGIEPVKIAGGFEFPEGASVDADGGIFLVNCHNDVINRVSPDGEVTVYARVPGKGNGTKLRPDGTLVVCDYFANCIVEIDREGNTTMLVDTDVDGNALSRGPNDVCIAKNGDLYFTTPQGSGRNNPVGKVYHHSRQTGRTTIVAEGLAFPNGLSLNADESMLYVAESQHSRIWRFPIIEPGLLATGRIFVQLSGGWDPDGIDFDENGNLYIAYFGSGLLVVVDPNGQIVAELPAGGKNPTNLSFGGPGGDWLYLTEAETNSLYLFKIGKRGLRLHGR